MGSREALSVMRASTISEAYRDDYNLTHTIHMIDAAERAMPEAEREAELLRIVSELELIYRDCREQLGKHDKGAVEDILGYAREDIRYRDYWGAIMNVFYLEQECLQEHLPELPNADAQIHVRVLLTKKLIESAGLRFLGVSTEPKDPADWWKEG